MILHGWLKNPHSLIDLRRALENNPHSVIDLRRALDKSSQFDRLAARSPMVNTEPVLAGALGVLRWARSQPYCPLRLLLFDLNSIDSLLPPTFDLFFKIDFRLPSSISDL